MGVMQDAQAWDSLNHAASDVVPTMGQNTGMATGRAGVVSVAQNQRGELREAEVQPALTHGGGKPGEGFAAVRSESTVRRLTPVECERLQGWPDGWTLIEGPSLVDEPRWFEEGYEPNEAMPAPDGRRYAACGDGVTATVAEWLGRRVMEVMSDD